MKAGKIFNYIWTFLNAILILVASVFIWMVLSNGKRMNLGLWNALHGNFAGFAKVDGLMFSMIVVLSILLVLLLSCIVFSKVKATVYVGKWLIDVWPIWNLIVTIFIVLSIIYRFRVYYPIYETQQEVYNARMMLESNRAIVHGAGWIEDDLGNIYDYTNSLEALTNSYDIGNRIVEMDFLWTSDNKMICAHENEKFARGIEADGPLSEEEFLEQKCYGTFTTMNVSMLADFMREHQDMYIVTDFKYCLDESCQYISALYPDLKDRFIVQIYHYAQYEYVRKLGFNNIILTLYLAYPEEQSVDKLCEFVRKNDLVAITFWENFMDYADEWDNGEDFFEIVKELNVPICVHTVNDSEDIKRDFELGVTAVYTDNIDNDWMKNL